MKSFKALLERAMRGESLGRGGAREAMEFLMSGDLDPAQIAAFLGALSPRHLGSAELAGFAEAMREKALPISILRKPLVDTCGTGGDGLESFNFSTAAAFVCAGGGVAVAKHGNRAVSSRSGSADVLEALGIPVDLEPEEARASIEEDGFGFLFAPKYHPATRHVAPIRKAMGVRTVFNLLGPISNPAKVRRQIIGVYDASLMKVYAEALLLLGIEKALVVRGEDGMDELTLTGPTRVYQVDPKEGIRIETWSPEDFGLAPVKPESLRGGDAAHNASLMEALLGGEAGPLLEGVLFNAAASFYVAGAAATMKEGLALARESVSSGKAKGVLEKLRRRKKARR